MNATFTHDGTDMPITVPLAADEITYGKFIDYQQAEAKFIDVNREHNTDRFDLVEAALIEAVTIICGPHVADLPFSSDEGALGTMIEQGYQIGVGSELSVLGLYAHLTVLLKTANYHGDLTPDNLPKFLVIEHGGKAYRVIGEKAARVMSSKPLTAGEAVEVSEYRRRHSAAVAARVQDGSALDFTLGLSEFAILVRRPGERLPADDAKREQWITERRKLLADLSLTDVMKVRFFLTAALLKLAKESNTDFLQTDRPVLIGLQGGKKPAKPNGTGKLWPVKRGT